MPEFFKWFLLACLVCGVVIIVGVMAPIAYVESSCMGEGPYPAKSNESIIDLEEHGRPEVNTFLTYPEWFIVHAYDEYAEVIRTGDPHDYAFMEAVSGYWSSLCILSRESAAHGAVPAATRQMVYTIGASFSIELVAKALYEETLGRFFALIRGPEKSEVDRIYERQAADYARFLQQTPWYLWDFEHDVEEIGSISVNGLRDIERQIALGMEYRTKATYADVIASAVEVTGAAKLTIRSIVAGVSSEQLDRAEQIDVVARHEEGVEIETPRYRTFTHLLDKLATHGAEFIEIAGNDQILLSEISHDPTGSESLLVQSRQGYDDFRHLRLIHVRDLAAYLRRLKAGPGRLEHIHDY